MVMRVGLTAILSERSSLSQLRVDPPLQDLGWAEQIEELRPDVVLLDLDPERSEPWGELEGVPLVVLAPDPWLSWTAEALQAGVRAILPQESTPQEIIATIEAVAAGLVVVSPEVMEALIPEISVAAPEEIRSPLTSREIEVLTLMAEGMGNKTIAKRLGISEHTVKFHIGSIFTKLNVSSRTEAVMAGARQGLILV